MNKRFSGYIVGGILILLGVWVIVSYNAFVSKEEKVKLQWAEVQNAYQRRLDLVPNLVNVVKGGADFEQTTLQKIAEARAKAANITVTGDVTAQQFNAQSVAQDQLAAATNRLLIVVEKYPDIQGTKAFSDLQAQLEGTERRIKFARKDFNASIASYNKSVRTFPSKIVASIFGFKSKDGFQSTAGSENSVEIKF